MVNITNYTKGELISFDPTSTQATLWKYSGEASNVDIVRRLRQMNGDLAKRVVDMDAESDPNIDVFEITEGDAAGKVWVDKQTNFPSGSKCMPQRSLDWAGLSTATSIGTQRLLTQC